MWHVRCHYITQTVLYHAMPRAVQVSRWLSHSQQLAELQPRLIRSLDCFGEGVMLCDPWQPGWPLLYRCSTTEGHGMWGGWGWGRGGGQ